MKAKATDPEYASIAAFVEWCQSDEQTTYTHEELQFLCFRLRQTTTMVRTQLLAQGLTLTVREVPKKTRGFTTSSNDRWFGPGADKTHGGSGFDNR